MSVSSRDDAAAHVDERVHRPFGTVETGCATVTGAPLIVTKG
jgi:hypothetical protein